MAMDAIRASRARNGWTRCPPWRTVRGLPRRDRSRRELRPLLPGPDDAAGGEARSDLVLGAGGGGLAAVAAARSLGGVVRAFRTTAGGREQVESLGAASSSSKFDESGRGRGVTPRR